ncbi:GNAT family N-acetyltransferase [Citricoccus nitrophenolicus]|uniref:GNAT family N-acetyltransferase n=1 Tax=Citricoccus nitrophenolicus TaxID=863575 RepID=A0ABV0IGB0_9MICC
MNRAENTGPDAARYFVRDAAEADLEDVLTMKAAAWREAYGHLRDEGFFAAAEATLDRQVEHWRRLLAAGQCLWLAEDAGGRCVGMAAAGPVQHPPGPGVEQGGWPEVQLYSLYVLAEAQGTGVADALLERAIGSGDCLLWVLTRNGRARAFYSRHGFAAVGDPEPMDGPWAGLDEQLLVRRGA